MRVRNAAAAAALGLCLSTLTGCPFIDARTSNQGGGNLLSAVDKVVGGRLASLTPDEVQILGDTASNLNDQVKVFLSDGEAADAVLFLVENELNSFEDIARFADEASQDPDSVQVPESLIKLVENLDLDALMSAAGRR
jgi:hypothetical protein